MNKNIYIKKNKYCGRLHRVASVDGAFDKKKK